MALTSRGPNLLRQLGQDSNWFQIRAYTGVSIGVETAVLMRYCISSEQLDTAGFRSVFTGYYSSLIQTRHWGETCTNSV